MSVIKTIYREKKIIDYLYNTEFKKRENLFQKKLSRLKHLK